MPPGSLCPRDKDSHLQDPVSHVSLSGKAWLSQSYMEPPPSLGHLCSVTLPVISTEGFPTQLPWLLTALRAVLCAGPVLGLYIGA